MLSRDIGTGLSRTMVNWDGSESIMVHLTLINEWESFRSQARWRKKKSSSHFWGPELVHPSPLLGMVIWYAKVEAMKENTKAATVSIRGEDEGIVEESGGKRKVFKLDWQCKLTQWSIYNAFSLKSGNLEVPTSWTLNKRTVLRHSFSWEIVRGIGNKGEWRGTYAESEFIAPPTADIWSHLAFPSLHLINGCRHA